MTSFSKIGDASNPPAMISAEEAISLFEADINEKPVDLSKNFDAVYQLVKSSLFSSEVKDRNEKEQINALAKIKVLISKQALSKDYLEDLAQVVRADALSGYEIRFINQLMPKDAPKLPLKISAEYLARIIGYQKQSGRWRRNFDFERRTSIILINKKDKRFDYGIQ